MKEGIILAGGLGKRMGNQDKPKWLTQVEDVTIAVLQSRWLRANGVTQIYVTLSRQYFDNLADIVDVFNECGTCLLWEDRPIGDEGGLKRALEYLKGAEAVVCNCDILTDLPLSVLPLAPALVVVHPRSPWGVLREKIDFDGRGWPYQLAFFEEKPLLPIWASAGIYRFPKSIRDELVDEGEIARNIVPKLLGEGRLHILKYEGRWLAIETPKDLEGAKEFVEHA